LSQVLLLAPLPLDEQRMGPAIRYWEMARVLSRAHQVTLLVSNEDHPLHPGFAVRTCRQASLAGHLAACDVVVVQGPGLSDHPEVAESLAKGKQRLVVDLYDPISLEQLAIDSKGSIGPWLQSEYTARVNEQLRLGDFFLCASERQRDYWLGALVACGRINHETWDGCELRNLIDVLPFGLPAEPPEAGGPVLKGRVPGIGPGDRVIVWGGGLWDWLDPLTPVRAMATVAACQPDARLVFFEAERSRMSMQEATRRLAQEMGLLDRHVFFVPWLAPGPWGAALLEADAGLAYHPAGIETRFAFRTRILDYIWAGLPVVTGEGDVLSEVVGAQGLGKVVPPGNQAALATAILDILAEQDARGQRRAAFERIAAQFRWEKVCQPLLNYCREPWPAGDAGSPQRRHLAELDRLTADVAYAQRQRAKAQEEAECLRIRLQELAAELEQSHASYRAAMDGRVMRLMTGAQQALRRLRRGRRRRSSGREHGTGA
jgi:hypothetical protein